MGSLANMHKLHIKEELEEYLALQHCPQFRQLGRLCYDCIERQYVINFYRAAREELMEQENDQDSNDELNNFDNDSWDPFENQFDGPNEIFDEESNDTVEFLWQENEMNIQEEFLI